MNETDYWNPRQMFKKGLVGLLLIVMVATSFPFIPAQQIRSSNGIEHNVSLTVFYVLLYTIMMGLAFYAYKKFGTGYKLSHKLSRKDFLIIFIGTVISGVLGKIFIRIFGLSFRNNFSMHDFAFSHYPWQVVLLILSYLVLSPILEEVVFRAYLIDVAFPNQLKWVGAIASAILFALFHMRYYSFYAFFYFAIYGLFLAIVYNQTRNVKAPIIMHIALNLVAIVLVGPYYN